MGEKSMVNPCNGTLNRNGKKIKATDKHKQHG